MFSLAKRPAAIIGLAVFVLFAGIAVTRRADDATDEVIVMLWAVGLLIGFIAFILSLLVIGFINRKYKKHIGWEKADAA